MASKLDLKENTLEKKESRRDCLVSTSEKLVNTWGSMVSMLARLESIWGRRGSRWGWRETGCHIWERKVLHNPSATQVSVQDSIQDCSLIQTEPERRRVKSYPPPHHLVSMEPDKRVWFLLPMESYLPMVPLESFHH